MEAQVLANFTAWMAIAHETALGALQMMGKPSRLFRVSVVGPQGIDRPDCWTAGVAITFFFQAIAGGEDIHVDVEMQCKEHPEGHRHGWEKRTVSHNGRMLPSGHLYPAWQIEYTHEIVDSREG